MRYLTALSLLAALFSPASYALARDDVTAGRTAEPFTPKTDLIRSPLVRRSNCHFFNNKLIQIDGVKEVIAYWTFGGTYARSVCFDNGWGNCTDLAPALSCAMVSIFAITKFKEVGVALPARDNTELAGPLGKHLAASYADAGIEFGSITDATPQLHGRYAKRQRKPVEVASVNGLQFGNSTVDLHVVHYGDGEGHVYVPVADDGKVPGPSRRRHRRGGPLHLGPGFKVSYATRKPARLDHDQQATMAARLGSYWAVTAANMDMRDLLGYVVTGHEANFYWRISPQKSWFGLEYESVEDCGRMEFLL